MLLNINPERLCILIENKGEKWLRENTTELGECSKQKWIRDYRNDSINALIKQETNK